jgi:co-chaperonin GroES (HSP10)
MNKINGCIGRSDGVYDKSLTPLSESRKVVLRMIDNGVTRLAGNILIPESAEMNNRMGQYRVEDYSDKAHDEYGMVSDDIVLADRLSVYYDTNPICVLDFENIICGIDGDDEPYPFKDMVFVKVMTAINRVNGGIMLSDMSNSELPLGKVVASSSENIKVGDFIPLSQGADKVTILGEHLSIYKDEMIIATVELSDEELENYKTCEVNYNESY